MDISDYVLIGIAAFLLIIGWRQILGFFGVILAAPWVFLVVLWSLVFRDKNPLRWLVLFAWAALAYITYGPILHLDTMSDLPTWAQWGLFQLFILMFLGGIYGHLTDSLRGYFKKERDGI